MSKVYSFRLDENNPRETQAREVINAWASKGYTLRSIFVDALISYGSEGKPLDRLELLLKKFEDLVSQNPDKKHRKVDVSSVSFELSSQFCEVISNAIKPGKKLNLD